jgi:prepilin-type N-terminal cleavage/methylation domain-containing protein
VGISKQRGFTIIEVMIVLAIAGLILLMVFYAVPSVQRTARNNRRRNDLGRFYAAIQDEQNRSAGQKAPFPGKTGNEAVDHPAFDAFIASLDPSFSNYTFPWTPAGGAPHSDKPDVDQIIYFSLHHCNVNGEEPPDHSVAGSHNDYVFSVLVGLEPSGLYYCLDNGD